MTCLSYDPPDGERRKRRRAWLRRKPSLLAETFAMPRMDEKQRKRMQEHSAEMAAAIVSIGAR